MASIELSKPAMLAAVAYLVMAFVILLPLGATGSEAGKPTPALGKRIMTLVLMLIPIGLSIYSINCMVVGKCVIWSWVNSIIIAAWVLLFLVAMVLSTERRVETGSVPYFF